jgi:hypothetical protein
MALSRIISQTCNQSVEICKGGANAYAYSLNKSVALTRFALAMLPIGTYTGDVPIGNIAGTHRMTHPIPAPG